MPLDPLEGHKQQIYVPQKFFLSPVLLPSNFLNETLIGHYSLYKLYCGCPVYKSRIVLKLLHLLSVSIDTVQFSDWSSCRKCLFMCCYGNAFLIFAFQSSSLFNMRLRAQQARWRSHVRDQRAEENTWTHPKFFIIHVLKILSYDLIGHLLCLWTMNTVMSTR